MCIYLFEKWRNRQEEILSFGSLQYLQQPGLNEGWTITVQGLEPGARNSTQVSCVAGRNPTAGPISHSCSILGSVLVAARIRSQSQE